MHYKFLLLPFVAAMLTLTSCGWHSGVSSKILNVNVPTKDDGIRERLLSYTPIGSEATNVLKFVLDDLRPKSGAIAYYTYVQALQKGKTNWLNAVGYDYPTTLPVKLIHSRYIYAVIGSHFSGERLTASWNFDTNDKLINIDIGRDITP